MDIVGIFEDVFCNATIDKGDGTTPDDGRLFETMKGSFTRLHNHPRGKEHILKRLQHENDWAGQLRKVDISKGATRFCTFTRTHAESEKLFNKILSLEAFEQEQILIAEIADIYCELNVIHPFREGSGRAQRFFFEELLFCLGMNAYANTHPSALSQLTFI